MANLSGDIRLAVDSGKVAIGANNVIASISKGDAKLVVLSLRGKPELHADIVHLAKLSGLKIINFKGSPVDLGAVCGKPFSVSTISVINPGNSGILENDYSKAEEDKVEKKPKRVRRNKAQESAEETEEGAEEVSDEGSEQKEEIV